MGNKGIKKSGISIYSVVIGILLGIYVVSLVIPLFWGLYLSFKSTEDYIINGVLPFPEQWMFSNYAEAFTELKVRVADGAGFRWVILPEMLLNTVLYAAGGAVTATLTPCVVAYCTAKFPYKFSKFLTALVVFCMIMPIIGNLPSEIQMAKAIGLYDNIWGLWIMRASFTGMYFLVFQANFKAFPKEFSEAAKVDGAGNFVIFFRIMLPLVRNTFFTIALIQFIGMWNDYQIPLIYIPNHPTIAYAMYLFSFSTVNQVSSVPMKLTGAMIVFVPIFIVFVIFHDRVMGNLTMGGIKG